MHELGYQTPALLFPTVSLILLAYTNRFLALANLIRQLGKAYRESGNPALYEQIRTLKRRVIIIKNMQAFGIASLFGCTLCLAFIFTDQVILAVIFFALALVALLVSLFLSMKEILLSVSALNIELDSIEMIHTDPKNSHR